MKYLLPFCLSLMIGIPSFSQSVSDHEAVKQVVIDLFDAMRDHDSTKLGACFAPQARLITSAVSKEGEPVMQETPISQFKAAIAGSMDRYLDEQITSWDIRIDGTLASVWADYLLYVDGNFSHCGVDAFQFAKLGDGWKIVQVMDTRRKVNCIERTEDHLEALMNKWHHAAATADEDTFFGMMTPDGVYIGTDATERWTRDELREWSSEYFDRETAWAFKPLSRTFSFSADGNTAWFDELLDTWMGDCRGSGVLTKTDDGWKIRHYHLAIAVPNEVVQDYLKLLKKE